MAESSSQNPSSPEITTKEELITLDKPNSPNPFLHAIQVEFTFEEIAFTTNNEVVLLYPSHPNQEYFKDESNFIFKCCLNEAFTRTPTQYKEYLSEFWHTAEVLPYSKIWESVPTGEVRGEIGYNREIGAKGTPKKSCLPPRWRLLMDFAKIIWEDLIHKLNKKTREKIVPYHRFHNWILKPNQPEEPPLTDHIKAICNLDVPVDFKAPKSSLQTEEVPQVKKHGAKMVGEMHKEAHQAVSNPTSLGATNEEGAHPQLSSDMDEETKNFSLDHIFARSNPNVLVDKTKSAKDGLKTAHTNSGANEDSRAYDILLKVNLEDLSDILKDTRSTFFTSDSIPDDPIIISDKSEEEEEVSKDKDTEDTSVPPRPSPKLAQIQKLMAQVHLLQSQKEELEQAKVKAKAEVASMKAKPSNPDINQLTKLLVTSLKPELSKLLFSHDLASCFPTELKELPLKITGLSREIKELQHHIKCMEIELPGDLIEIPTKLESLIYTISSLSSQVAKLKNIQWKLPIKILNLLAQVSSVQEKLKTLDSLPSLLHKVTDTLNRFATMEENASGAASMNVPSACQATASPAEGEKNTKDEDTNIKDKLIDLLGKNVVTQYYTKKLLFDKYCNKILKRRKVELGMRPFRWRGGITMIKSTHPSAESIIRGKSGSSTASSNMANLLTVVALYSAWTDVAIAIYETKIRVAQDSIVQNDDLKREVSNEEIKRAVWDCGIDKAPGPDGFTFGFYRRYWDIIGNDVVDDVKWFFLHGEILKGGNSSFITLISKVPNANMVKDFRPISLSGSLYKVIAKVMANRLVTVLDDIVD
nr:RNA-directed DNA polymerase, eukaryota, reverse transcriptase zinc-binding domain protein [Tanacetum cinerariifolium]